MVDEGHKLKNINCRLIKTLKAFKSENRLLLTGTPLQVRICTDTRQSQKCNVLSKCYFFFKIAPKYGIYYISA